MNQHSEVWSNFEQSDFAKKTLGLGLQKTAAANTPVTASDGRAVTADDRKRDSLYDVKVPQTGNVGPLESVGWQDAHQSTHATGGGGGAPDGRSRDGYNVKSTPIKAAEDGGKVENIAERHSVMEDVATKAPTGKPMGTQGNEALKWDSPKFVNQAAAKATQIKTAHILKDLVKLAEQWETDGDKEEFVREIDAIIDAEVKASKSK